MPPLRIGEVNEGARYGYGDWCEQVLVGQISIIILNFDFLQRKDSGVGI